MVQLFQRYVPYARVLDFLVQGLLCLSAFGLAIQATWWMGLQPQFAATRDPTLGPVALTLVVLGTAFCLTGFYQRRLDLVTASIQPRALHALVLGVVSLIGLHWFAPSLDLGWESTLCGLVLMSLLMTGWHFAAPTVLERCGLHENVLVLGSDGLAFRMCERILESGSGGLSLAGFVPITADQSPIASSRESVNFGGSRSTAGELVRVEPGNSTRPYLGHRREHRVRFLGSAQDLDRIVEEHDIHSVVVALDDRRGKLPLAALIKLKLFGIKVYDAAVFNEQLTGRLMVDRIRPSWIIFSQGFCPTATTAVIKRSLDVLLATLALILSAPLQAVVALMVIWTSPGPALFCQERVGLRGSPFPMLKFRTMRQDAETRGPRWAAKQDDRVTPVGRFLRCSRLDELPQLWNVLLGQMSFVGPRPERPCFVGPLRDQIPYYEERHCIRPGITGWAQVKYPYGASIEESLEKLEYDLYYIKHMSVAFDLTILLETVVVLLTGKGAR